MKEDSVKVLLADDEEEFINTLAERLSLRELEVSTALEGEEALSLLSESEFDVAVIDFMMPGISGTEVLKKAKSVQPGLEVIILTGKGSTREGIEGMQYGAFDYLMKPVDIETLVDRIRSAAELKRNET